MSAYIVDDAHIDALIDIAKQYTRPGPAVCRYKFCWAAQRNPFLSHSLDDQTETEIGRMLLAENARSVGHRCREVQDPAALTYVYRPTKRTYTPAQALMVIRGYEYQACETDDWDRTEAHDFCRALYRRVVDVAIPQEDTDYWTVTDRFLGRENVA